MNNYTVKFDEYSKLEKQKPKTLGRRNIDLIKEIESRIEDIDEWDFYIRYGDDMSKEKDPKDGRSKIPPKESDNGWNNLSKGNKYWSSMLRERVK